MLSLRVVKSPSVLNECVRITIQSVPSTTKCKEVTEQQRNVIAILFMIAMETWFERTLYENACYIQQQPSITTTTLQKLL